MIIDYFYAIIYLMKHRFWFWLAFGVAILLGIYSAARVSIVLMGQGGALSSVRKISVYSGNCENTRACVEGIAALLDIAPGTKRVDLKAALARVAADPDVGRAAVRRLPNGEIKIRARMRVVVAAWTDGENYYPLDETGASIARPLPARPSDTLVFSGRVPSDISGITAALKRAPALFYGADRVEFVENRRWDVFLLNGIRIMLPEENFASAAVKIEKMNKQNMILARKIKLLDLRDPARPLVVISH
jgi:cell division septal protein FtsQ